MVSHLIADLQKFDEALSREHYLNNSGQKDELESSKIYKQFKHLFSKEHIVEASRNLSKREGKLLYDAFVGNFIGNQLKRFTDKANSYEASAVVEVSGQQIPFRQVTSLVTNEDIRERRKLLFDATKPVKKRLTSFERRSWKKVYALIQELSGRSYVDYLSFIKEVDYDSLAADLKEFLVKTEQLHKQQIEKNMASIGVRLKDAQSYDYAYFARAKPFDQFFKKEKLVDVAKNFWHDVGFDICHQKNVFLDVEERPKKVPRAFCMPVKVPEEVILVIKPNGGQDDYQAFLHESGHTEHFANTDSSLSYEFRHLGDHSVSESYAFLIEYLLSNTLFLQKYLGMAEADAQKFATFLMEQKLQAFRRYAAKVIYELKLHRNDLTKLDGNFAPTAGTYTSPAKMYVDILTKATKINYKPESYLLDVDSGLYAADYVRAWCFEVMIRKKLEEKFGRNWFEKKEAGEFLKSLWKWGSSGKSVNELAKMTGYDKVDTSYITEDFIKFFKQA
jgi:oligoendopeptidase F